MEPYAMTATLLFILGFSFIKAQDVFVTVDSGTLRGTVAVSQNGATYNKFVGVPYAKPPLGELRFKAPLPPANWTGVRDALVETAACIPYSNGSEDCLYLNVFAPVNDSTPPLPVMLFTYGGAFQSGSDAVSSYGPDFFVEHGVILVDYNYRAGPLGFLSLQNEDIPGNAGLKDMVAVLQWIQRNIAAFGGDPTRVTNFGHSSGACAVAHAYISPATAGLFSGTIIQSGQAISPWGIEPNPREKAYRWATALGFPGGNDTELAEYLRSLNDTYLTSNYFAALSEWELQKPGQLPFSPVIEPFSETAVVWEDPITVLKEGRFNQVPLMTGVASADGATQAPRILNDEAEIAALNANFTSLIGSQLLLSTEEEQVEAAAEIYAFYFGDQGITTDDPQAVYDFCTDMYWLESTEKIVRVVANLSSSPVFYYYVDYNGTAMCGEYGCSHGAEIFFLFISENGMPNQDPDSLEGQIQERMITMWTNFAKYREPAPGGMPVVWDPYTPEAHNYLDMQAEFVQRQDLLQERMQFWLETVPI